jgi:hypothetical protein
LSHAIVSIHLTEALCGCRYCVDAVVWRDALERDTWRMPRRGVLPPAARATALDAAGAHESDDCCAHLRVPSAPSRSSPTGALSRHLQRQISLPFNKQVVWGGKLYTSAPLCTQLCRSTQLCLCLCRRTQLFLCLCTQLCTPPMFAIGASLLYCARP